MIAHERELQRLRLQNDLDEKKHVHKMERLTEGRIRPINSKDQNSCSVPNTLKIPTFDENLDEMDSYFFALKGMLLLRDGRQINGLPI